MIDLRSDTVTKPTDAMRKAMAEALVGDDAYREDPTVQRLEETVAERFGMEAALLCPTGIMCNQIWLRVLGRPGTEVVVESDAHLLSHEGAAGAFGANVQFRTVPGARGILSPEDVARSIRAVGSPVTPTSLVWIEHTHNRRGGTYYELDDLRALRGVTSDAGVTLYMDGARIFNAAVAAGVPVAEYAALVDALMFCLSKGLAAPVGSVMVGSAAAIEEARIWRQRFGGAMRQSGVIAAAGLVALEQMVDRLAEDHEHARLLALAAAEVLPSAIDPEQVATNIVIIDDVDAASAIALLRGHGVLAGMMDVRALRLVTHADVSRQDCERAAEALREVLRPRPSR